MESYAWLAPDSRSRFVCEGDFSFLPDLSRQNGDRLISIEIVVIAYRHRECVHHWRRALVHAEASLVIVRKELVSSLSTLLSACQRAAETDDSRLKRPTIFSTTASIRSVAVRWALTLTRPVPLISILSRRRSARPLPDRPCSSSALMWASSGLRQVTEIRYPISISVDPSGCLSMNLTIGRSR